ncbi:hypothetical protein C8R44DRAFT_725947 [Mycena epipterygia]|nr:hypothetical protein C8R44DRAFT_725947 [Mycena epipterygia]
MSAMVSVFYEIRPAELKSWAVPPYWVLKFARNLSSALPYSLYGVRALVVVVGLGVQARVVRIGARVGIELWDMYIIHLPTRNPKKKKRINATHLVQPLHLLCNATLAADTDAEPSPDQWKQGRVEAMLGYCSAVSRSEAMVQSLVSALPTRRKEEKTYKKTAIKRLAPHTRWS